LFSQQQVVHKHGYVDGDGCFVLVENYVEKYVCVSLDILDNLPPYQPYPRLDLLL